MHALLLLLLSWTPFQFLIGDWVADTGAFSLYPDLKDNVLVRRNHAETKGVIHDDLMVIYQESGAYKAIYWDNEGHVIRYEVQTAPGTLAFVSAPDPKAPRYRLSYKDNGPDSHAGTFDIAPPNQPDAFRNYLTWTAKRKPK